MSGMFWYAWIGLTLVGVILMGVDKRKAIAGAYRIRERTLFTIACVGGSVGVWAGMYMFRQHSFFRLD